MRYVNGKILFLYVFLAKKIKPPVWAACKYYFFKNISITGTT